MVLPFQEVMSAAEVVGYGGEGVLPLGAGAAAVGGLPGPRALAVADGGLAVGPEGALALEYVGEGAVCGRGPGVTYRMRGTRWPSALRATKKMGTMSARGRGCRWGRASDARRHGRECGK